MLDQRRRRWADVVQMLYKYFVLAAIAIHAHGIFYKLFYSKINKYIYIAESVLYYIIDHNSRQCKWQI